MNLIFCVVLRFYFYKIINIGIFNFGKLNLNGWKVVKIFFCINNMGIKFL